MNADSKEAAFQQDIVDQMVAGGFELGDPAEYVPGKIDVRSFTFEENL